MTVRSIFDLYKRNVIQFENQARKTEEHHNVALRSLSGFIGDDVLLADLTFEMIRDWRNYLEMRNYSIGTIYGYIVRLRCVLKYAKRKGLDCLDVEDVKPPKRHRKRAPGFLTEEDIARLIHVALQTRGKLRAKRNAAIVALFYSSGIRVGELVRMNITDVHYNSFVALGKGNKSRPCFIDCRARELINQYLKSRKDSSEALFVSDIKKDRLTIGTVQLIFRNIGKKSGITKRITPHIARHSFATNFLRNNGNLRHLQDMLGHESLETTQMYTHVEDYDLHQAHKKYHSISAPKRSPAH